MATKRVLIGTPSKYGHLDVWFVNALRRTEKLCAERGIQIEPVFLSFDALVQRARNDIAAIALQGGYDYLMFIDDDIEWDPEHVVMLLKHEVDCVGAAYRKKTDDHELYAVKMRLPVERDPSNGLWLVEGLGGGFMCLSRKAVQALWDASEEYENEGKVRRWIFDVCPVGRSLVGEDTLACMKLAQLGFKVLLDPRITVTHIGPKKFQGDFAAYVVRLENEHKKRSAAK